MTEAEWQTATDPSVLLQVNECSSRKRKRRLFECACCRRIWHEILDDRSRLAVTVAERYADGLATDTELEWAWSAAEEVAEAEFDAAYPVYVWPQASHWSDFGEPSPFSSAASSVAVRTEWWDEVPADCPSQVIRERSSDVAGEAAAQATLLRDIFGNPFRPVAFDTKWRTEQTVGIALKMYEEREFAAMPILADALEEAGCDNQDILTHCREPGVHVRGCWVVDLVLGKE